MLIFDFYQIKKIKNQATTIYWKLAGFSSLNKSDLDLSIYSKTGSHNSTKLSKLVVDKISKL